LGRDRRIALASCHPKYASKNGRDQQDWQNDHQEQHQQTNPEHHSTSEHHRFISPFGYKQILHIVYGYGYRSSSAIKRINR